VSGEEVRQGQGAWISGPSITSESVMAQDIEPGDRLVYDNRVIEVTDFAAGYYWFPPPDGHSPGVAIGWKAGNSSGLLFRHGSDLLERVTSQP
jgi:hypothetical protein